jgi:hypothetical protein
MNSFQCTSVEGAISVIGKGGGIKVISNAPSHRSRENADLGLFRCIASHEVMSQSDTPLPFPSHNVRLDSDVNGSLSYLCYCLLWGVSRSLQNLCVEFSRWRAQTSVPVCQIPPAFSARLYPAYSFLSSISSPQAFYYLV